MNKNLLYSRLSRNLILSFPHLISGKGLASLATANDHQTILIWIAFGHPTLCHSVVKRQHLLCLVVFKELLMW